MTPPPNTLRHLVCSVCGLSNRDQSWSLVADEWIHECPVVPPQEREFEDDPTPVTEEYPSHWIPPTKRKT